MGHEVSLNRYDLTVGSLTFPTYLQRKDFRRDELLLQSMKHSTGPSILDMRFSGYLP